MKGVSKCFVGLMVGGCAVAAHAVVVDFDNLANGTVLTSQYGGLTFSSSAGSEVRIYGFVGADTAPNIICTYTGGTINCTEDTNIDFANPVNNLTFWAIEPNTNQNAANIDIFQNNVYTTTYQLTGIGGSGNLFVDFSAFSNITRLQMRIDPNEVPLGGIGWDTFTYDVVPEPASMIALGAGLLAIARRRRK